MEFEILVGTVKAYFAFKVGGCIALWWSIQVNIQELEPDAVIIYLSI